MNRRLYTQADNKASRRDYRIVQARKQLALRGTKLFEHEQTHVPWERTPRNRLEQILRHLKIDMQHGGGTVQLRITSIRHAHHAVFWRQQSAWRSGSRGRRNLRRLKRLAHKRARRALYPLE